MDGLSLAVEPGQLHCIVGPNGAGKSTLFKLLAGTDSPTSGRILYEGRDITRLLPFQRARLGISIKFQNVPIYQELTVAQNLFIPLRRHHRTAGIPGQIENLLNTVHLPGTATQRARSLSHGQQQWLSLGMSLAASPKLLLLDEPAAGMSREERDDTARIIRHLVSEGVTIVVIEHDMSFIRQLDARVSVLHYGKLFAQGTMDEIESNASVRAIYLGRSLDTPATGSVQ